VPPLSASLRGDGTTLRPRARRSIWSKGERRRAQAADVKDGLLELEKTKSGKVRRVPPTGLAGRRGSLQSRPAGPVRLEGHGELQQDGLPPVGITDFHVHRCRHDRAIQWLAAGGSLATLQDILGHASIATTMRYARITQDLVTREARPNLSTTLRHSLREFTGPLPRPSQL